MYAGRNEEDTEDDIVFYCMNAYWEPLVMQLPVLPNGKHWHVDTNTLSLIHIEMCIRDSQETIAKIDPMPGAKEFLDEMCIRDSMYCNP